MQNIRSLPYRRSFRLPGYDYRRNGIYFITLCQINRVELFGRIINGVMIKNDIGNIIEDKWVWLKNKYSYIQLDSYVVMPNHIHGLLIIDKDNQGDIKSKSLGSVIGAYKTVSTKCVNILNKTPGRKLWQRNYWEHIVKNESDFNRIQTYIKNNPQKWYTDKLMTRRGGS